MLPIYILLYTLDLNGWVSCQNPAVWTSFLDQLFSMTKKIFFCHYNKHLIDWGWMGGCWSFYAPCIQLCLYKHELDQYLLSGPRAQLITFIIWQASLDKHGAMTDWFTEQSESCSPDQHFGLIFFYIKNNFLPL
jgi:hypothetical protein